MSREQPNQVQRVTIIATLMLGGIIAGINAETPSTREEREEAKEKLDKAKKPLDKKMEDIEKGKAFLGQLKTSVEALEKSINALKDGPEDIAETRKTLQASLAKMQERQTFWNDKIKTDTFDLGKMRRDFVKVLKEDFLATADLQQVLQYKYPDKHIDGIGFDSLSTPRYLDRTSGGKGSVRPIVMVAEHDWMDNFFGLELPSLTQHQDVTAKDVDMMLSKLSGNPGYRSADVGRIPLMLNASHWDKGPGFMPDGSWNAEATYETGAWKNVFANKRFPIRGAVSNSTSSTDTSMANTKNFDEKMKFLIGGEGTKTVMVDNVEVIDGYNPITRTPWCNAVGNAGPNARGDFSIVQLAPNSFNWGVEAIPPVPGANRKSNKVMEVEGYSTGTAGRTDFCIARPRWDGNDPMTDQYIPKDLEARIRGHLCQRVGLKVTGPDKAGKYSVLTEDEWDVIERDRPGLRKTMEDDIAHFCPRWRRVNGCDEKGVHHNMGGTSFAGPVGAAVVQHGALLAPDADIFEMRAALIASAKLQCKRQVKDDKTLSDIKHVVEEPLGFRYAPGIAGYGSICYEGKDTSVQAFEKYLKIMHDERIALSKRKVTVTAFSGATKQEVVLNGQPPPRTLKFWDLKETPSDAMKKRAVATEAEVTEAFKAVITQENIPADKANPIYADLKAHNYEKALEALIKEAGTPKVTALDALPIMPGNPDTAALARGLGMVPLAKAKAAVATAVEMEEHTYTFKVPPNCDLLSTVSTLYLKFKEEGKMDRVVELENPDGRRLTVGMGDATKILYMITDSKAISEVKSTSAGRTSGFNTSALGSEKLPAEQQGVWKLHTRRELKIGKDDGTRVLLFGSMRDKKAGVLSVAETKLMPLLEKEAKARTAAVPKENIVDSTEDPHARLRRLTKNAWAEEVPTSKSCLPATTEEQREFMEAFFKNESKLYQQGFIPKDLKPRVMPVPAPESKKTSRLTPTTSWDDAIMVAAAELSQLYDDAQRLPERSSGPNRQLDSLSQNWGRMAAMACNDSLMMPSNPAHIASVTDRPETFWQKRNRDYQYNDHARSTLFKGKAV